MAIKAKNIKAENVVGGVQVIMNGEKEASSDLIQAAAEAARQILADGHGSIEADEIVATNVVEGLQYVQNSQHPTLAELRKELAAKTLAVANDPTVPQAAKTALATAQTEAQKAKPEPKTLLDSLKTVSEALKNASKAAPNVLKIIKWIPVIATAIKAWAGIP